MTLSQYITAVRRLLNDSQRNYWPNDELTDYINEARRKTAVDTICVRDFQLASLTVGQERYTYNALFGTSPQTIDVINVTLLWGATRVPMRYAPFTIFSAYFRPWINYRQLPVVFSVYNMSEFWLAPNPDQTYQGEFDTARLPLTLANDNTVDDIPIPYSDAVKYYAAYLARLRLQQYTEAKAQLALYQQRIAELGAMPPRRIPYVYTQDEWGP